MKYGFIRTKDGKMTKYGFITEDGKIYELMI